MLGYCIRAFFLVLFQFITAIEKSLFNNFFEQ